MIPVSVRILFTPTYLAAQSVQPSKDSATQQVYALRRDDFWRDFQFELRQEKKILNRAPPRARLSMTTVDI